QIFIEISERGELVILNATLSESGLYHCMVRTKAGVDLMPLRLTIKEHSLSPTAFNGQKIVVEKGRSFSLPCEVTSVQPSQTMWYLPKNQILLPTQQTRRAEVMENGTLVVRRLTQEDAGEYSCLASNLYGVDMLSHMVEVTGEKPPKSTEIAVYLGKSVTLDCFASGKPPAQISWILPDRMFVREVGTVHTVLSAMSLLQNGTLQIHSPNFSSKGDYKCIASNAAGADTITYHLHVAALPPSISEGTTDTIGESAKLSCQATGEPTPKIMWISPRNDVISMSSEKFQIMDDGTLVVRKVRLADEGKYACVARNSAGDDVKNMKLEVEPQEPFINGMKGKSTTKVLAISYQTALLDCRVEGKPEPRVWWVSPYGHSLPTPYLGGRFQVHRNGSLELRGVRKTDEGRYMCLAKNSLGEASLLVELDVASVAEKPSFAVPNIEILPIKQGSGLLSLECPARGKPNPESLMASISTCPVLWMVGHSHQSHGPYLMVLFWTNLKPLAGYLFLPMGPSKSGTSPLLTKEPTSVKPPTLLAHLHYPTQLQ
uniref:Ig-like domain-containing protein n=1 Tax=Dicentrarchus labrax TaxID=13489 RepID=A0A8C4ELS7_DICLA